MKSVIMAFLLFSSELINITVAMFVKKTALSQAIKSHCTFTLSESMDEQAKALILINHRFNKKVSWNEALVVVSRSLASEVRVTTLQDACSCFDPPDKLVVEGCKSLVGGEVTSVIP